MAHDEKTKARAMAMLLTGDSARHVAKKLSIPVATVLRWRSEAFAELRAEIGNPLGDLRRAFAGLRQNGSKKES